MLQTPSSETTRFPSLQAPCSALHRSNSCSTYSFGFSPFSYFLALLSLSLILAINQLLQSIQSALYLRSEGAMLGTPSNAESSEWLPILSPKRPPLPSMPLLIQQELRPSTPLSQLHVLILRGYTVIMGMLVFK
ncbi:hypothetical protein BDZ91DRAFT_54949 [Kalaharituber pfeilii]|nr:hypothetical protein BDZ91DRAFT_54949 [Kalaharituber pfeilii]